MPFDNRHTIASRRTVLPPAVPDSRTFTKGIALGVVVGAVSATLTYAALFAGPSRTTSLMASAAVVSPKPSAGAAARPVAADERDTPAPASTATASEPKNVASVNSPAATASSDAIVASPDAKAQVQREESRPRQRRERHVRRERPRNPTGWYVDAGTGPWGRSSRDYRGRPEWSW